MAIIVTCPCGRQLRLDEQFVGKKVRCPICQQIFMAAGSAGGDFQIENTLPPSEPAPIPPRLREAPATLSPQDAEPATFDLAPSDERESTPPRSRPRIADDEADDYSHKIDRIKRKNRRPSGSQGLLRPGTWSITKALDIIASLMLIGAAIALFLSILNIKLVSASSATPQRITLSQLLASGPGNNAHVIVTDFVPARNYVYLYQKNKYEVVSPQAAASRHWTEVWVPLVPLTPQMKAQLAAGEDISRLLQPQAARSVVRLANVHDRVSVEQWCNNKLEVQGMIVNSITSLNSTTENLLKESYPGTDFSTCLLIHEGREPPTMVGIIFGFALGTLLIVVGGLWFIFRFV